MAENTMGETSSLQGFLRSYRKSEIIFEDSNVLECKTLATSRFSIYQEGKYVISKCTTR